MYPPRSGKIIFCQFNYDFGRPHFWLQYRWHLCVDDEYSFPVLNLSVAVTPIYKLYSCNLCAVNFFFKWVIVFYVISMKVDVLDVWFKKKPSESSWFQTYAYNHQEWNETETVDKEWIIVFSFGLIFLSFFNLFIVSYQESVACSKKHKILHTKNFE